MKTGGFRLREKSQQVRLLNARTTARSIVIYP